ncbi:hypothetical protein ACFQ9U_32620 [Streptomyces sp. NPDC056568]|uniref:hypothetical protein n=1 Tax=Streptomyces sp. NPDC056568 TaxID=3345866 RepID=UPI00367AAD5D
MAAAAAGGIVWAVAHFGLEKADQTSSAIGGTAGAVSLLLSLFLLPSPAPANGDRARTDPHWVSGGGW